MKPQPPADLWGALDSAMQSRLPIPRPEGGFTFMEFKARYQLTETPARRIIAQMMDDGKVKKIGGGKGQPTYYVQT